MNDLIQTRIDQVSMRMLLSGLKLIKIVPTRTTKTSRKLARAADNLVVDDEKEIFISMYFMIVQKPQL
jgi:hypothetical protein